MLRRLFARVREFFAGLFRRAPPRPGRWISGRKFAWHGRVNVAPWVLPSREFLVYLPRGHGGWTRSPLVVFIHGCKQTPEEFAAATRIAAMADEEGWVLLMPRQTVAANRYSCWNWFDRATAAGRGEAAIVLTQVRAVLRKHRVDRRRVFVAGFSSGGALAAAIGLRHPHHFAGVFAHSALAAGAASRPTKAFEVMARGADSDAGRIGEGARKDAGPVKLPLLAIHGDKDDVVAPVNGEHLAQQYRALNGDDSRVQLVRVSTLGHAWGGGDAAYPYNDPKGPDATAMLRDFIRRVP